MMRYPRWPAAACLLLAGCGNLGVGLTGQLPGGRIELPHGRSLSLSALGTPRLDGRLLQLPEAQEVERFGVVLVDAGKLPPIWRPAHAQEGGLLVASIQRASPLAVAGLRPFERISGIDGTLVTDVASTAARLRQIPLGQPVTLAVVGRDGKSRELLATANTELGEGRELHVPFLYNSAGNQHESAFSIGPLDGLYWTSRTLFTRNWDYYARSQWGTLFNLVRWRRTRNLESGKQQRELRLFWIIPIRF